VNGIKKGIFQVEMLFSFYVISLYLRSSSEPNSMNLRFFPVKMGASSSLVRSHNGLAWEVLGKNSRFLHDAIIPHHDFFFVFIRAIFFFSFFLSIFALENQRRAPAFR
jgi:hypothetical protein